MSLDKTWVGVVVGLLFPILTSFLFFKFAYAGELPYFPFLRQMTVIGGTGMLVAVSCLPNLALFTLLAYTDHLKVSRGLFLSSLLYAFVIVILKFAI